MCQADDDPRATVVAIGRRTDGANARDRDAESALLVRVGRDGDREAFRTLFNEFAPRLRTMVSRQGFDGATGESIVQDVMIATWTRARSFDPAKASARTWLYALTRNRLIDEVRASRRRERAYDAYAAETGEAADSSDAAEDWQRSRLDAALKALPAEQAQVILMGYVESRSHREIAEQLGIAIGTVKSRTRLALKRLRKLMERTT